MNKPVNITLKNYEVENYKQYLDVEKEKIIMKMWFENKEIMTKQHKKSLPPYESKQWKGHWSSKEKLQHVDMKIWKKTVT